MKLVAVATHPIQYHAPWFRGLASRSGVDLRVFFGLVPSAEQQGVGFDVPFEWDVPVLEGYRWEALPNAAREPSLRGFFSSRTPEVGAALDRADPDVAILTGWQSFPLLQALRACRRRAIPTVLRAESSILKPRPLWVRSIHRGLLTRFDAFLAIGRSNRRFYRRNGVDPAAIFDAPYFVDNDQFLEAARRFGPERDAIRRGWGIPPEATCFLFSGKLVRKKRPLDFLEAIGTIAGSGPPVHALVVGTGETMEEARGFSARDGLPVTFAGFLNQSEIGRAYAAADCLVLPSDYDETWGLVVNEAMVSGKPAVVSDRVGCGPDLVVEGETGWVVPFGDVAALARRLGEAAAEPARLASMGGRARERILEGYTVERAVEGTLRACESVASEPAPAALS